MRYPFISAQRRPKAFSFYPPTSICKHSTHREHLCHLHSAIAKEKEAKKTMQDNDFSKSRKYRYSRELLLRLAQDPAATVMPTELAAVARDLSNIVLDQPHLHGRTIPLDSSSEGWDTGYCKRHQQHEEPEHEHQQDQQQHPQQQQLPQKGLFGSKSCVSDVQLTEALF